ncbi:amidohydrolase [Novosphingobium colocasiae]|uniref:Amidohydrolase n=1 Tax=Novosphingobium colocasiae TaxID=1256513 RepID=A0A918UG18_9SPHN|nr:amidohydrolase [Novosphingobium colocasiae]GGZ03456.1 amidohydrolase [Novosphingobium colocasiae]
MSRRLFTSLAAIATALVGAQAQAQDFAVTHATVALGDGTEPISDATVVVRGGRIAAAGAGMATPAGIPVIDGTGKWVTPGIFAAYTDLGLWDVDAVDESNDKSADDSPFNAALDISVALNPASEHIAINRAGGVTRASVTGFNGKSIFAGQGAVIDLGADPQMLVQPRAFQVVSLGENGAKLAGGSRVAAYVTFRNALREARDIAAIPAGADRKSDVLLTHADAVALVPVVQGVQKLYVEVERAADIRAVLALRTEFPKLDMVIVGATEGWMVAADLAAAKVPVLVMPMNDLPAQFEQIAATQSNIGRMTKAGVKVGIGMFAGMNQPRYAPQQAGNMVALTKVPGATGLSWGQALAAITSIPADITGMGGQKGAAQGVLKPGAVGDVVLWDGDPLELSSAPVKVWIDGIDQPLTTRQTRLRDRYKSLDRTYLPKAYDW